jgi:hypothetical protein
MKKSFSDSRIKEAQRLLENALNAQNEQEIKEELNEVRLKVSTLLAQLGHDFNKVGA